MNEYANSVIEKQVEMVMMQLQPLQLALIVRQ
jgi:hypothetical protein